MTFAFSWKCLISLHIIYYVKRNGLFYAAVPFCTDTVQIII